jgi:Flp pilus assembly pilin Flp
MGARIEPHQERKLQKYDHPGRGKSMSRRERVLHSIASSRGQTMAEYALILATIAMISVALVQNSGVIVTELVDHVSALL